MHLAVSADHAGFELKNIVRDHLRQLGHEVDDLGVNSKDPADYPDCAESLGTYVLAGKAERGILICGSGIGAVVAANKIKGIRAGLAHDNYSAHQGVEHDDMNILVLGGRVIGPEVAKELAVSFVNAHYTGEERHARRLAKVKALEEKY